MSMKMMEKSTLCRICLAKDVRMCDVVNTNLQETYESLTAMHFETKDSRPSQVCYICYAQLQTCHKLRYKSLQSEELFRQVSDNSELKLALLHNATPLLTIGQVAHLSIVPVSFDTTDTDFIDDGYTSLVCSNIIDNVQVKEEHVEGTVNVFDAGEDNVSEAEDTKPPLSTNNNSGCKTPLDSSPQTVKIGLQSLELTNIGTIPAPKEQRFTEQESKTVSGEEVVNDSSEEYFNKTGYFSSQLHTDITDKPYKCDICGKCFKTKMYLIRHARLHTEIKAYGCNICGKDFKRKDYLSSHMLTHTSIRAYACNICGKDFKRKDNLSSHMLTHTGIGAYVCSVCGKDFKGKEQLSFHIFTHTGIREYACDVCGKGFTSSVYLKLHVRRHTSIKAYACDICGRSFKGKEQLSFHMQTHTGTRAYECDICGKGFTNSVYLKKHIRRHTGTKAYECDNCGKSFTNSVYLNKHMRRQTCIKPYACNICEKHFKRKEQLSRHILTHTCV